MEYNNDYLVAAFEARKTIVRLESELKAERERSADWRSKAAEHKLEADEARGRSWQPVSEAPEHVAVLACEPGCGMAVAKLVNGEWRDDHGSYFRPTHWMPLPPWPLKADEAGRRA